MLILCDNYHVFDSGAEPKLSEIRVEGPTQETIRDLKKMTQILERVDSIDVLKCAIMKSHEVVELDLQNTHFYTIAQTEDDVWMIGFL